MSDIQKAESAIADDVILCRLAWCIAQISKNVIAETMAHANDSEPPESIEWPSLDSTNFVSQKWLELGEKYAPEVLEMIRKGLGK